ncbi:MAG: chalcone isomerase family protein [Candidatus Omnitrophica bacterium]|nr:chalcone isomerase family protein [Candidatus Omnitrophota bacterium]
MKKIVLSNIITVFAILFFLAFSSPLYAGQIGPAIFQETYKTDNLELKLQGAGLKTFLAFKVVAAGLYLEEGVLPVDVLENNSKRLEVVYLQPIRKKELQNATTKGIKKNVSEEEFWQLSDRIEQINAYYPDVQPQDRIEITYDPEIGTTVSVNGQYKGTIEGKDFARAFFAIWVGDRPVDRDIKLSLLGYKNNERF